MNRAHLSMRIDPKILESVRIQAKRENRSVTECIEDSLTNKPEVEHLHAKIKTLETTIERVQDEYRKITGRKYPKTRRVSIGLTDTEYHRLNDTAHKHQISKSDLIRKMLFPTTKNTKALAIK